MKVAIFGLTISSSWGNGHATLWRGLCKALHALDVEVVFFERDVAYYAQHRDAAAPTGATLLLYDDWTAIRNRVRRELRDCDAAIVTSYCPDALAARDEILDAARPRAVFYELDAPVTLATLRAGHRVAWLDHRGLRDYNLVLSYAGGPTLQALRERLGAHKTLPLYGHADPDLHCPTAPVSAWHSDLCWLGTWAADRQHVLEALFVDVARARPAARLLLAGAQYPADFPWQPNIWFTRHLPPSQHAGFLCSARLVLNVTRAAMARAGWCPSGRLFETAACGVPIIGDAWSGLDTFYEPGKEILLARDTQDVLAALDLPGNELARIGAAARERTLATHTSLHRARELLRALESSRHPVPQTAVAEQPPLPQTAASFGGEGWGEGARPHAPMARDPEPRTTGARGLHVAFPTSANLSPSPCPLPQRGWGRGLHFRTSSAEAELP